MGQSRDLVILNLGQPTKPWLADNKRTDVFELERGNQQSIGRATGHAVMDRLTLGGWELIGIAVRRHAAAQSPAWLQKTPPVSALDRAGGRQYVVQLGAFSDHADAIKARTELAVDLSDILRHDNRPLRIIASKRDSLAHVVFAQAFPTPEAAAALCAAIKTRGPARSVTAVWPVPGSTPPGRGVAEAHGGQ